VVLAQVDRDPVEPGAERSLVAVFSDRPEDPQKGVLYQILGEGGVPYVLVNEVVEGFFPSPDQQVEGSRITILACLHQAGFLGGTAFDLVCCLLFDACAHALGT